MQLSFSDNYLWYYNFKILNVFDSELQLINPKPTIKNKFKKLKNELKKLKVQSILILEYKERNGHKAFYSNAKLIVSDSDINEAFESMYQSIMTKTKNFHSED